jgi:hypothetical protein
MNQHNNNNLFTSESLKLEFDSFDPQFFLPTPSHNLLLPTPSSTVNPFLTSSSSSMSSSHHTEQQQHDPFMSNVHHQIYNIASEKNFEEEEVGQFLEGLDSSTFHVSPHHQQQQYQQQQMYQQQQQYYAQQQQQQQMYPGHNFSRPMIPSPQACFSNTTTGSTSPHNFSGSPFTAPSNLIKLVEGFNKPLKEKQIGGKDNTKHCLTAQVIELTVNKLPTHSDPSVLSVRANVLGYDRVQRTKVILGFISEKQFEERGSGPMARWLCVFDDIIMQHSSHNNGQKLALRFQLLDADKRVVCHVDSYEFETITKRGLEKIKERQKRKRTDTGYDSIAECVEPPMGFAHGGQLVKVLGNNFVCSPTSQVSVTFGDRNAREIHTVKRNYIVCETPENDPGKVQVNVEFDRKGPVESNATFHYVDQSDQLGV